MVAEKLSFAVSGRALNAVFIPLCVALIVASLALIFEISGVNWVHGLSLTLYYGYGTTAFLLESLLRSVPLFLISIGLIFPFTAGVWNIGAEGQFYIGAIVTAGTALAFSSLPFPIPLVLATLSGCLGGTLYALIPAFLRVKYGINELLTSLMLNFVAYHLTSYLLLGPMKNPLTQFAETPPMPETAVAPVLVPSTRFNALTVIALIMVLASYIALTKTRFAISIRYMGANPVAAQCSGIDINRLVYITMGISGALAGLASAHEVLGVIRAVRMGISMNYGYVAIGLAYFGGLHPVGAFAVSLLAAGVINGTLMASFFYNIPIGVYEVLLGMVPLYVVASRKIADKIVRSLALRQVSGVVT